MIDFRALNHIMSETQKTKEEIIEALQEYVVLCNRNGCRFWVSYRGKNVINGHSDYFGNKIRVSSAWVIRVLKNLNNVEVTNAFKQTIGHELGHKKKEYFRFGYLRNLKTMRHVVEINCDFYATQIMFNGSRTNLINSIQYKMKESKKPSKSYLSHPSWEKRLEYAINFDFNDELIKKIAKDVGCTNSRMVAEMIDFYKDRCIYLTDE